MDCITQGILGAAVGQSGFSQKLGRRAIGWGAIIGMLPDLDVLIKLSSNPFAEVLYHKGITHAILFGPIIGPLLGYLLWCYYQKRDDLSAWIGLGVWALVAHSILSLFTAYGTQLLAPFSDHRFALSAIPAIDPIYTGILLLAVMFGYIFHRRIRATIMVAYVALTLTTAYLFFGLAQNENAYLYARNQLIAEGIPNADVRVYPTMYQIFLRRVVVHFPNEVWVGFISTWAPNRIPWYKQPQAPIQIRQAILNHPYGKIYNWFTSDELIFRPHQGDPYRWDMLDSRFGFAGNTIQGLSGRTVSVDANGIVYDDFNNFQQPHDMQSNDYKALLYAAFGKHYVPTPG